ncbi:glycosyltransferase family 4 protein [Halorutilales archaeon Cl-col2-1]
MSRDEEDIRVCHVVNSVGESSVPADIAVAITRYTDVEADILAWFNADEFDNDDIIDVSCVNAPDNVLGVSRETYAKARDTLKEYDIIQAHHNHSGTYAKIIGLRNGIPVISTEQNNHVGFTRKGRLANGITNAWADRITCVSQSVYESFNKWEHLLIDDGDVRIIYNGVDIERIEEFRDLDWSVRDEIGISEDIVLMGTAGMLTEQKAHDTLIQALLRANKKTNEEIHLVIAGDGELRDHLKNIAKNEDILDNVHFLGFVNRQRAYKMMEECDIYAMPSRWEGFSAAAVEAMSLGSACIFSDIGEFKHSYEGAALFHPVDDSETLSERVVELTENPEKRKELGKKARERAKDYSTENISEEYVDLYEEVLSKNQG